MLTRVFADASASQGAELACDACNRVAAEGCSVLLLRLEPVAGRPEPLQVCRACVMRRTAEFEAAHGLPGGPPQPACSEWQVPLRRVVDGSLVLSVAVDGEEGIRCDACAGLALGAAVLVAEDLRDRRRQARACFCRACVCVWGASPPDPPLYSGPHEFWNR